MSRCKDCILKRVFTCAHHRGTPEPTGCPQDSDTRSGFERFIQDRARQCPIANMINQLKHTCPEVTEDRLIILALENYANKADALSRLLTEYAAITVAPFRVV